VHAAAGAAATAAAVTVIGHAKKMGLSVSFVSRLLTMTELLTWPIL
jgi:hypothetical protein